jgi:hypothetical protein
MARGDKTLAAMRTNPRDWRIASLEAVAAAAGVNVRKSGGSHVVFGAPRHRRGAVGPGPPPDQADLCPAVCPVH